MPGTKSRKQIGKLTHSTSKQNRNDREEKYGAKMTGFSADYQLFK